MKLLLAILAVFVQVACLVNFFIWLNRPTPIPIWISHPVMMIAIAYLLFQHFFPAALYRGTRESQVAATQNLKIHGVPLATTTCGGCIGAVRFRGPLLRVDVYADGVLFKPLFMPEAVIFNHEITAIRTQKTWLGETVMIEHTSPSLANPIELECAQNNLVRQVLFTRAAAT